MMKHFISLIFVCMSLLLLVACGSSQTPDQTNEKDSQSFNDVDPLIKQEVFKLIVRLTLEEKVGQMIQAERNGASVQDVKDYNIGSILSGGGSVPEPNNLAGWNTMYSSYRDASLESSSGIPIIYGVDAVHGHNNVYGSTIFPHNIGLGAANDKELMTRIGEVVAQEMSLTGVDWNFAPALSTVQDIRWGRSYEGFSENPEIVENLVASYIAGLQKYNIAATAKHFIGDGATEWVDNETGDYAIDRENAVMTEEQLRAHYLPAYEKAVKSGVKSIMVSYSSYNGLKMHQHKELIMNVLKDELEFNRIVISDWEGINEITGNSKKEKVINAINAGIDMLMEPYDWRNVYTYIIEGVQEGKISMNRIDDSVTRILIVKHELGLFEEKEIVTGSLRETSSLEIAREAVRKSLVLLKNENSVLPLNKDQNILLIGPGSDNIGVQCGGWSLSWQGSEEPNLTKGTTIKEAFSSVVSENGGNLYTDIKDINKADVVVLVLAEKPYAEGVGDNPTLTLDGKTGYREHIQLINQLSNSNLPVVTILVSGRPLLVDDYIDDWDAFVAAWLPGTEGDGITDVLFGDYNFTGKLPMTWPKDITQANDSSINNDYEPSYYQFPYQYGLNY